MALNDGDIAPSIADVGANVANVATDAFARVMTTEYLFVTDPSCDTTVQNIVVVAVVNIPMTLALGDQVIVAVVSVSVAAIARVV